MNTVSRRRVSGGIKDNVRADGKLMSVAIRPNADTFVAGPQTALFQTRLELNRTGSCSYCMPNYDVAADGRFLMTVVAEESSAAPINLILNWSEELKRLVPTR